MWQQSRQSARRDQPGHDVSRYHNVEIYFHSRFEFSVLPYSTHNKRDIPDWKVPDLFPGPRVEL